MSDAEIFEICDRVCESRAFMRSIGPVGAGAFLRQQERVLYRIERLKPMLDVVQSSS